MELLRFTFLVFMLTECFHSTNAMGLCDFAEKLLTEENEGTASLKNLVNKKQTFSKAQTPILSTTEQPISNDSVNTDDIFGQTTTDKVTTGPATTNRVINTTPLCPRNMLFKNCTACQGTCLDPKGCSTNCTEPTACICPSGFLFKEDDCVLEEECDCFVEGEGVVPEGEFYVDADCTRRGVCNNSQLIWNNTYICGSDEICEQRNNVRQCYGPHTDCLDIYKDGFYESGVYKITPTNWTGSPFQVYCNMMDGGGWTVFQRREDGSVDFYQNWTSYKEGFGSPNHEHWLGNDKLYYLTNQKRYTIRIDFVNLDGSPYYAEFDYFQINDESDFYRLSHVGLYSGTAGGDGHPLTDHLDNQFSTYDEDHDIFGNSCAKGHHGAWWYNKCMSSNLNGRYNTSICIVQYDISWQGLPGSDCNKYVEMKIRPF